MKTLVLVEHDNASVKDATLAAVTAAGQLGEVTALVAGADCDGAATAAAQIAGVARVLKADDAALANALAENVAPLVAGLMADYDAFVAPATTTGKNVAPRVAALLDVAQISDATKVISPDTFERPIYAGNAIATVQATDEKKVITVRTASFQAAGEGGSASVESVNAAADPGLSTFVEENSYWRSLCHAWSAHPVLEFQQSILGVRPVEPGFARVAIRPHRCGLTHATGRADASTTSVGSVMRKATVEVASITACSLGSAASQSGTAYSNASPLT